MTEQRKYMRFDTILDVFYNFLDKPAVKTKSYLRNLSKEGLRLIGGGPLKKGSAIELEMNIPGDNIPIYAFGEVAWTGQTGESGYDAGIKFTKIKSHDRLRLLDFVYDQWVRAKRKTA